MTSRHHDSRHERIMVPFEARASDQVTRSLVPRQGRATRRRDREVWLLIAPPSYNRPYLVGLSIRAFGCPISLPGTSTVAAPADLFVRVPQSPPDAAHVPYRRSTFRYTEVRITVLYSLYYYLLSDNYTCYVLFRVGKNYQMGSAIVKRNVLLQALQPGPATLMLATMPWWMGPASTRAETKDSCDSSDVFSTAHPRERDSGPRRPGGLSGSQGHTAFLSDARREEVNSPPS